MATKETKRGAEPFEALYARLEAAVDRLQQGGLSLDDAIACYEEGMTLARACQERLDDAEQRITKLRESFAPVLPANGATLQDADSEDDVEYVADDDEPDGHEYP